MLLREVDIRPKRPLLYAASVAVLSFLAAVVMAAAFFQFLDGGP